MIHGLVDLLFLLNVVTQELQIRESDIVLVSDEFLQEIRDILSCQHDDLINIFSVSKK